MATSSIFSNVKITDSRKAETFINALDAAANSPKRQTEPTTHSLVTDPQKLMTIMSKRVEKK